MHEILDSLPRGSRVLDLGCAGGSFARAATPALVVRLDRDLPRRRTAAEHYVCADARFLPFSPRCFQAVISNHSLEHLVQLDECLRQIRRVLSPDGALYVAVPNASTLTDKLYRWLARGGGHINAFTSAADLAARIETLTGLTHVATRPLCSSLSFLNRRNSPRPLPLRLYLLGAGYEWSLFVYAFLSRRLDRFFRWRTSEYGWALYFGTIPQRVTTERVVNVCIRCGSGCSGLELKRKELVRQVFLHFRVFRCPTCGATNPFAEDS